MLKTDNGVIFMKSKIWILLPIIMLMLNSCYYRELDLNTGSVNQSELEYIRNYDQEVGATEIRKIVERSSPDIKSFLDNR